MDMESRAERSEWTDASPKMACDAKPTREEPCQPASISRLLLAHLR
jgi:hypothetical protein